MSVLLVSSRVCVAGISRASLTPQVRYLGLMENIRVRRAGYAFRLEYERFLERFKMLSKLTWPKYRGGARDGVKQVCERLLCVG